MASSDGPVGIPLASNDPSEATAAGIDPIQTVLATSRWSRDWSTCPAKTPFSPASAPWGEARKTDNTMGKVTRIHLKHRKVTSAPSSGKDGLWRTSANNFGCC